MDDSISIADRSVCCGVIDAGRRAGPGRRTRRLRARRLRCRIQALFNSAKHANAEAQYRLGLMYKFGWGASRDAKTAANWFRLAADQEHAEAQSELGVLHKLGRGVKEDAAEAARWFRRAADSGVGHCAVESRARVQGRRRRQKDLSESYAWFTLAAGNGYADGFSYRARIAEEMSAEEIKNGERLVAERGKPLPGKERNETLSQDRLWPL